MSARSSVAPFLQKTYEIVSEPKNAQICSWGAEGDSLFIHNIEVFARDILPNHFKHCKYSSFTRQLFKYDFHKTAHDPRHGEFKHPCFLKGKPELLCQIKRKVAGKTLVPAKISATESGSTDEETDGSSEEFDVGFFQDLDAIFADDLKEFEFDFDEYDEIESTAEKGILSVEEEKISVLEKRQAHLISENDETRNIIHETLLRNNQLMETMDIILNSALNTIKKPKKESKELSKPMPDADEDELVEMFTQKCHMTGKN